MAHDVFISYSSINTAESEQVCAALEGAGIACWMAPRDIQPSETWAGAINRAIKNGIIFLLLVTKESNSSAQVLKEVTLADRGKKKIIPFFIEPVTLSDDLDYYLPAIHWMKGNPPPLDKYLPELIKRVRSLLPGASTPVQRPTNPGIEPVPDTKPAAPPEPAAGATRVREKDGMVEVYVPAGEFLMGSNDGGDNEKPPHKVYLDAYWIDQTPVTNAMFARFIAANPGYSTLAEKVGSGYIYNINKKQYDEVKGADWRHPHGAGSNLDGLENHPVVLVSWEDAKAYCVWVGTRLPTEAQWEKAARGTDGRTYPWGEKEPDATLANFNMNVGATTPVGSYPAGASPYDALDLAGNVWEWCADWYGADYYAKSPPKNPTGPVNGSSRSMRGGCWDDEARFLRAACRAREFPGFINCGQGFRCLR